MVIYDVDGSYIHINRAWFRVWLLSYIVQYYLQQTLNLEKKWNLIINNGVY